MFFTHRLTYSRSTRGRYTSDFQKVELEQNFKYGFIDETGQIVVNPIFEGAHDFSEGLAAVCVGTGCYGKLGDSSKEEKWGYIDRNGKLVITPQFESAGEFKEGFASVSIGGKYGYIDKSGKFAINPQFYLAWPFDGGFANVSIKEGDNFKYGWIDRSGKYVWQPSD